MARISIYLHPYEMENFGYPFRRDSIAGDSHATYHLESL